MTEIGYTLSSEEREPAKLVEEAIMAERAGFDFLTISDHFHPWTDRQGNAPFVWTVIGAVAAVTTRIPLITAVTCPGVRIHPAIIAQAAATAGGLMPGRFTLGVGSGENLNEHILGDRWPPVEIRQEMLEEAVDVIRKLWEGSLTTHRGRHYTVENARIYSLPDELPPIAIATGGERGTELAGRKGDAVIGLVPDSSVPEGFARAGGQGKPAYGQIHVSWDLDEKTAVKRALEVWPNTGIPGNLFVELPLPSHFEEAAENVTEEDIADSVVCGPNPDRYEEEIREFVDAGYSHVFIHQVESAGEDFFEFAATEVLPRFS